MRLRVVALNLMKVEDGDDYVSAALDDAEQRIGRNMRRIRENLGLSQLELSKRLGKIGYRFHQTQVAKIERGERPVRVNEWIAIAAALGVEATALMAAGFGADDAVFEARLRYERSRVAVDDIGDELFQLGRRYQEALEVFMTARREYWRACIEHGVEPEEPDV
jgi:transcriptional regulator with XRE-family HTH domain